MDQAKKLPEEIREEVLKWPNYFYDRGVEDGMERGIKKGIEKGELNAQKQFARKLLQNGISHGKISEWTGLSEKEITELECSNE